MNTRIKDHYPPVAKKSKDALRLMLVDVTMNFADKHEAQERVLFEAPMGLMALMSYINEQKFAEQIEAKIYKAQMDFNSWEELYNLVNDYKPDLIGFRVMTYYKKLLFQASDYLRKRGVTVPIIVGGPHATSSYREILENSWKFLQKLSLKLFLFGIIGYFSKISEQLFLFWTFSGHFCF